MLNDIMDGVTRRLDELFGDEYTIYTDEVEQGLQEPCFFVGFMEPSEKPMLGRRSYRETGMYIQYLPGHPAQVNRELYRVSDLLMDGLETITLNNGDILRGTGRSSKVSDGVLHFFVNYNMFVIRSAEPSSEMEDMEADIKKG